MPDSVEHVIIASNPKSGSTSSRTKVSKLREAISGLGFNCDVLNELDAVRREAIEYLRRNRLRAVVSAGGDGTAEALTNLLPEEVPILPFPLGTENLLAKHLGITGEIRQACDTLRSGTLQKVDVGSADGRLFLVMLSCGFDAEVVKAMNAVRKGHITRWSYVRPILTVLRKYRFPQISFVLDGDIAQSHSAAWIFVFNVPRYAARLAFCPQADPLDGYLDVCTFRQGGILRGLGYLSRVLHGSHQAMHGFKHYRCKQVSIEKPIRSAGLPAMDCAYQIDGDPGGVLPLSVNVVPQRLRLLRPPSATSPP